jgi:DNA polymerase II small subunit
MFDDSLMTKQEIMSLFLKNRIQLDLGSIDYFEKSPEDIDVFLGRAKSMKIPSTVTLDFIQGALDGGNDKVKLLSSNEPMAGKLSAQDYAQYFSNRFDAISRMISRKMALIPLVSIGKIGSNSRKFSIVGIVKEKDETREEAVLEDSTGCITVQFDDRSKNDFKQLVTDEVIGAVCDQNGGVNASNIIWPDLPIRKDVSKSSKQINCVFVSDIHKCDTGFMRESYSKFLDYLSGSEKDTKVFVLGDVSHDKKDVDDFFSDIPKKCGKIFVRGDIDPSTDMADMVLPNPSMVNLGGVNMLLCHGSFMEKYSMMWGASPEVVMTNLLKKRHIDPIFDPKSKIYKKDPFLLEAVPDIFASGHFHKPCMANYKCTTILSTGSFISHPIFWSVDISNREVNKLDFS